MGIELVTKRRWDSADRILARIGRFVLLRPGVSGLLLLTAALLAFWSNTLSPSSDPALSLKLASSTDTASLIEEALSLSEMSELNLLEELSNLPQSYTLQVKSGDTLSDIFERHNVNTGQAVTVSKLSAAKPLGKLKLGQEMRLLVNPNDTLNELFYAINDTTTLIVKRVSNGFETKQTHQPITELAFSTEGLQGQPVAILATAQETTTTEKTKTNRIAADGSPLAEISNKSSVTYVSADITHSLYTDARKAGLSVKQANQLGQIFSANGLAKKLRKGDHFAVLYEKASQDGTPKKGDIKIAHVSHKGQTYQFIRFTDPKGKTAYYDPKGMNPLPSISRTPVKQAKLNSTFSMNRMHPVLHIRRPHLGVDYGAPTGTPIAAAGDGVIAYKGYKGGYGNTVIIKHDSKHNTLYGHMSRFAKDIKSGTTVKEGQVIGYIGSTGLASGPHLHYEIHVNNVPKNPLTVALPSTSIPAAYKRMFLAETKTLVAQLQMNQATQFAKNRDNKPAAS